MRPDPEKLRAAKEFPVPVTKKGVRSFLELTGYYRKFIGKFATIATSLTDLTRKQSPDKVKWTQECTQAFENLKTVLCEAPVLVNPDFTKQFNLQTDASNRGVGAVKTVLLPTLVGSCYLESRNIQLSNRSA